MAYAIAYAKLYTTLLDTQKTVIKTCDEQNFEVLNQ